MTGSGRSGTSYLAGLLARQGLRCGHEDVFSIEVVVDGRPLDWYDFDADVSWLAVPMLADVDAHRVLVVRRPLPTVRSFVDLDFFVRYPGHAAAVARYTPATLDEVTLPDRALAHWIAWNALALPNVDEVLWLETLDVDPAVPRNDRADDKPVRHTIDRASFRPELLARADELAAAIAGMGGSCRDR